MSEGSTGKSGWVPSSSDEWTRLIGWIAILGFVFFAYWIQLAERDLTCVQWLFGHWKGVSNYSHGPLIPLIASGLVWWNVSRLPETTGRDWKPYWIVMGIGAVLMMLPDIAPEGYEGFATRITQFGYPLIIGWQFIILRRGIDEAGKPFPIILGVGVLLFSVLVYFVGIKGGQPRITVFSFVCLLLGIALTLGGRNIVKVVYFPIIFLLLMIPLNFLDEVIGFPLRMFVSQSATFVLNALGIETIRVGTGIYSSGFRFDVADPCSGIRSLMALTTITAAYGYITQRKLWKKWFLFLTAMPLAVLGNMARVTSIALVAEVYGQELAGKTYHDYSGYIVFGVALTSMVGIGLLLNFPYRKHWENWTKPVANTMIRSSGTIPLSQQSNDQL